MNISLPAPLKDWIEQQVIERGYSTASEYVRDLLRREQTAAVQKRVDERLLHSLDSGPPRQMSPQAWQQIQREGTALARRRKSRPKLK